MDDDLRTLISKYKITQSTEKSISFNGSGLYQSVLMYFNLLYTLPENIIIFISVSQAQ